jgi:CPA2 family monovalent cation:H+ antiporter-2
MHDSALSEILILLVAAVIAVPLCQRLKLGPVLGYLLAGVVIGPSALGLIGDMDQMRLLAELGVVFLLFAVGLEMKLARLAAMGRFMLGLGGGQVILTATLLALALWATGFGAAAAIVGGCGLALSSTAIVLQVLADRGKLSSRPGRVAFAVLIMQDLAVVPMLALVPNLGGEGESLPKALGLSLAEGAIVLVGIILFGRFLLRPFLRMTLVGRVNEVFAAGALLLVLGCAWITAQVGLSMALGAFLAGVMLAETEFRHQIEADLQPFRGFLLGLFFITVGMEIDPALIARDAGQLLALLAVLVVVKAMVVIGLARLFRLSWGTAIQSGLLLAQGGEFAFVLFGIAVHQQVMPKGQAELLTLAVSISMVLMPILAVLGEWLAARLRPEARGGAVLGTIDDIEGHVIIAGFGRVGQTVARLLQLEAIPYVALDLDADRVDAMRKQGFPVFFGDASQAQVMRVTGAARARAVVVTMDQPDRAERATAVLQQLYPGVPVFARARDRAHGAQLRAAGATMVMQETAEASLQLGVTLLRAVGVSQDKLEEMVELVRADDYAFLVPIATTAGEGRSTAAAP